MYSFPSQNKQKSKKSKKSRLPADVDAHVEVVGVANRSFDDFVAEGLQRGFKRGVTKCYKSVSFVCLLHGSLFNGGQDVHQRGINRTNQFSDLSGVVLSHLSEFAWKGFLDVAFGEFSRHRSRKGAMSSHSGVEQC